MRVDVLPHLSVSGMGAPELVQHLVSAVRIDGSISWFTQSYLTPAGCLPNTDANPGTWSGSTLNSCIS